VVRPGSAAHDMQHTLSAMVRVPETEQSQLLLFLRGYEEGREGEREGEGE